DDESLIKKIDSINPIFHTNTISTISPSIPISNLNNVNNNDNNVNLDNNNNNGNDNEKNTTLHIECNQQSAINSSDNQLKMATINSFQVIQPLNNISSTLIKSSEIHDSYYNQKFVNINYNEHGNDHHV
ncbi:hypothetical protein, partial [Salmonella sp. s54836]|uniref:hypothetical protein n=1 Tax=Salmonella sp. s54836 TaxID=3159673 RepID=UPI003981411B